MISKLEKAANEYEAAQGFSDPYTIEDFKTGALWLLEQARAAAFTAVQVFGEDDEKVVSLAALEAICGGAKRNGGGRRE